MDTVTSPTAWQRWVRQPQRLWLRRVLFQIHLWCGLGLGLYIFFISITGSVLVYRNELYVLATPEPPLPVGLGVQLVSGLISLHESFLLGPTGRMVNGFGGVAVLLVAFTGLVIWWPGRRRWRKSLALQSEVGWKRQVWNLHSMTGFWCFGVICLFALSGVYLSFPQLIHDISESIEPTTIENAGRRWIDTFLYWLAFLHFGRIDGIGIPCSGPGLCDQSVKALWAFFGLAPALMFATGATMWWNRVLNRWLRRQKRVDS